MVGRTVSHYRIESKLGGGGMGVVYGGVDLRLERPVALKFLPREFAHDEAAKARFLQEAKAASRLDHPHISVVHEIDETADGHLFIVMPRYDGETLKAKIARGPLRVDEAIDYVRQIAEGLQAAHAAGITHRDVKPANVLVTSDGDVKIVDFGLAKMAGVELTQTGSTLGTAAYMSPEQARGDAADHRTDLWSLGVVLYEMLAGRRPFDAAYAEAVVYTILHDEPTPVGEVRPEVPESVQGTVHALLRKDPDERPPDAEAVMRALDSAEPEGRAHEGSREAATRSSLSKRVLMGVGFAAVAALLMYSWSVSPSEMAAVSTLKASPAPQPAIAVLPFEVTGEGAEEWRSGMVTVLSTGLDGAVGLRAIPDRTIFAAWKRQDPARATGEHNRALQTARYLEAQYAVDGRAVAMGGELRLSADVYDTASGRRLNRAQASGSPSQIMQLSDDLTRQVLEILVERGAETLPSVDLASVTTKSLPAMKAYLAGERAFGSGDYEGAIERYEEAVRQDSGFALAYSRLAASLGWLGRDRHVPLRRAYELSDRLPLRERKIIWARHTALEDPLPVLDSLRAWAKLYPDDPTMWYELGDMLVHNWIPGRHAEADGALQRAVSLDPDVAGYHHHLLGVALSFYRDSTLAAARIEAHPQGLWRAIYRTLWDLTFRSGKSYDDALARLDTLDPFVRILAGASEAHPVDLDVRLKVLRRLEGRNDMPPGLMAYDKFYKHLLRGQIGEAVRLFDEIDHPVHHTHPSVFHYDVLERSVQPDKIRYLAGFSSLGYPLPDSLLDAELGPAALGESPSITRLLSAGVYAIEQNRTGDLDAILQRIRDLGAETNYPKREIETAVDELRGYRAWKAGDFTRAAEHLSGLNGFGTAGAIWRGDLYRALGDLDAANGWYEAAWGHPVAHERLGQLYEEMDEPARAAAAYERFVAAWEEADEPLQVRVAKARDRIRNLTGAAN